MRSVEIEGLEQRAEWIRALARELAGSDHEAEDLAQDAWVIALTHGDIRAESWPGWVASVLRNLARMRWRGARRRDERERSAARPESQPPASDPVEQLDAHEAVVRAVRALDEPYRETVLLRYFTGLPPRAIASRLGIPVDTVDTRLRRALAKLRHRLDENHRGDRGAWLSLFAPLLGPRDLAVAGALAMNATLKVAAAIAVALALIWFVGDRAPEAARVEATLPSSARDEIAPPREVAEAALSARVEAETSRDGAAAPPPTKFAVNPKVTPIRIGGVVVDAAGQPLAGIRVTARAMKGPEAGVAVETSTDSAGEFELSISDWGVELDVVTPNWIVAMRPRISAANGASHVFVLAPQRQLAGIVVDGAGAPLANVELRCTLPRDLRTSIDRVLDLSMQESWTTRSDEAGAFAFAAAPDLAHCELLAAVPGFDEARVELDLGQRLDLRVVLARHAESARHLVGRVLDVRGQPVSGAFVAIEIPNGPREEHDEAARTNGLGEFDIELRRTPETARKLFAVATGSMPAEIQSRWDSTQMREVWPQPLELVLDRPALTIAGSVVRDDGEPARGAVVVNLDTTRFASVPWSQSPEGETFWASLDLEALVAGPKTRETWTDKSGRFELPGLLAKSYRLRVHDPATLEYVITDPIAAGSRGVEVRLPKADVIARIAGRVVDSAGAPVVDARVALARSAPAPSGIAEFGRGIQLATKAIATDDQGRFEFRDVSRLVDELRVHIDGRATMAVLPLSDVEDLERVEFVVQRVCHFKLDLTGSALHPKAFSILDAAGVALQISESRGKAVSSDTVHELDGQATATLSVADTATTLVLFGEHHDELVRMDVRLTPSELTVLRP